MLFVDHLPTVTNIGFESSYFQFIFTRCSDVHKLPLEDRNIMQPRGFSPLFCDGYDYLFGFSAVAKLYTKTTVDTG